jgi:hypothetical protein
VEKASEESGVDRSLVDLFTMPNGELLIRQIVYRLWVILPLGVFWCLRDLPFLLCVLLILLLLMI